jgi:O-acetyl-ADP-ribose deacetylase (regulator of RNase III)
MGGTYKKLFDGIPNIIVEARDIIQIPIENTCFVSPANSLGFMDGGIDWVLSRELMPGIEPKVKAKIAELGILTTIGRPYLSVGSVIAVPHDDESNTILIVAPTMFLPHNVCRTQNAYWSFYAALKMWNKICKQKNKNYTLVATSHCCGCGKMSGEESAKQMKQAYDDFIKNSGPEIIKEFEDGILFTNRDMDQPNNYDNREIKELQTSRKDYLMNYLNNK